MDKQKRADALKFLQGHSAGVLATSGKDGQPHASVVFYVADEHFNIHFLTLFNSRKCKSIAENPKVAFTVGRRDTPQTIQIEGVAEEAQHEEGQSAEADKLIDILTRGGQRFYAPLVKLDKAKILLVWIRPTWIRWADYSPTDKTGTKSVWTDIPIS